MHKMFDLLKTQYRIIFDGAMGTELQKRGLTDDPALLNLTAPEHIIDIHREYLQAGADILTANTFGAYIHKHSNAAEIIKAAVSHGRTALAGAKSKWLALDLGPTGLMLEPYGDTSTDECRRIFHEAVQVGVVCGVDLILIETMMDLTELRLAVEAAKETGLPVIATMSFDKNGRTMMGATIDDMVQLLEELEVDALGMNCGFGPDVYAPLTAELSKKTKLPIIVQPNAGMPLAAGATKDAGGTGKIIYDLTVDDFVKTMASMNVKIMGGCCGTGPEHIAALVKRFK